MCIYIEICICIFKYIYTETDLRPHTTGLCLQCYIFTPRASDDDRQTKKQNNFFKLNKTKIVLPSSPIKSHRVSFYIQSQTDRNQC